MLLNYPSLVINKITLLLILLIVLSGCGQSSFFQVEIDTGEIRQTLRDVGGGNYIHRFSGIRTGLDPISTMNLDLLQPEVIRTRIDLDQWDPDPDRQGQDRYQDIEFVHATFEFMREIKNRNPGVIISASIWTVPDWMVTNPEDEKQRTLNHEIIPSVVESIAQWLVHARNIYDVDIAYVSFNEANIGINVLLTPQEQIEIIRLAGPRFSELGLSTRWLLGDSSGISNALSYSTPVYEITELRPYLGPLSFHSWDALVEPNQTLKKIGEFADQNGLEVWCTEAGWDAQEHTRREDFPTWKHAFKLATVYTRVLRDTRTTSMFYWQMMGKDYYMNDGFRPFPGLVYLEELKAHFPPGSQIVKTPDGEIDTLAILSLAAHTPGAGFSVQLINQLKDHKTITLSGLPNGQYSLVRLSEADGNQGMKLATISVKGKRANLELDGMSIYFLKRMP